MNDSSLPDASTDARGEDDRFRFVANYGLLVCLGEGGMGEVWAAQDPSNPKNRIVALKTTKQQGAEAAKVLYDEARIASLIEHPNVCSVHHLGKAGEVQYLVMDYCDGGSLHDLLEASPNRKLPLDIACRIVASAAAGLHAAHELTDDDGTRLGVVHRDVSPQNILLSTRGRVTVTDFGVAKALGQAHKATETGEMKGKLSYMAPEQVTSKDVDARADVFALGCVLYQVTVGQRPFHGNDALSTMYQLLEEELSLPRAIDPEYPEQLEQIIEKTLAKDKQDRYQSAAEFRKALEQFLVDLGKRPTEADVADYIAEHLGEPIGQRNDKIQKRLSALSKFDKNAPSGTRRVPEGSEEAASTGVAAEAETTQGASKEKKASSKIVAWSLFGAIAIAGVAVIGLSGGKEPEPETKQPPPPTEPTADAKPPAKPSEEMPEKETVTLEVSAIPESAVIRLDGDEVGQGAYSGEFPSSSKGHVLEVSADGYRSVTRAVVFDKTQSLTIALSPAPQSDASAPTPKPRPVPRPQRPQPKPKPDSKTPRKLDSDNPFATP